MELTKDNVLKVLSRIIEPDLKKDIVELDMVREVSCLLYTSPSPRDA